VQHDDERQAILDENLRLKDLTTRQEYAYRDLIARVTNALRPNASDTERSSFPPGHYYSPIPAQADLLEHADRIWPDPPPRSVPGIDLNEEGQLALLAELAQYYPEQPFSDEKQEGLRYYFQNDMFSYADALYLYGMLRKLRPHRLIEVGSGYSSSVTLDTNERFLGGQVQCTFVDPEPQRLLSLLSADDWSTVEIIPGQIQDVPLTRFDALGANDILFIDSSHVSKAGSDVNHLFFEVLPRLAAGVYVFLHDMFYPFEYPREWLEWGRHYTEDYLIRAFLMHNHDYEMVLFGSYLYTFHADRMRELMPLTLHNPGASLWLRKVAGPQC
jgi:hypothetical protein